MEIKTRMFCIEGRIINCRLMCYPTACYTCRLSKISLTVCLQDWTSYMGKIMGFHQYLSKWRQNGFRGGENMMPSQRIQSFCLCWRVHLLDESCYCVPIHNNTTQKWVSQQKNMFYSYMHFWKRELRRIRYIAISFFLHFRYTAWKICR